MSRVDGLIRDLCPTGVEYRRLGDVGTVVRGKRFVKDDMLDDGVPCIHYGEIYTKYGVSATASYSFVSVERAKTLRFAQPGDVIIASAGETVEDIGKSVAWLGDSPIAIHDACYAFSSSMDAKFVSYFFASRGFRDQIKQFISSSKISSISTQNVAKALIPVPPLEVQREIVRVLDQFTQLEAELEAELEARRRQYEHYQRQVFTEVVKLGAKSVPLRDVGRWYGGGTPSKAKSEYWSSGTIPWISPKDMGVATVTDTEDHITEAAVASSATKLVPPNAVAVVARSSILDHSLPVAFVPAPSALNQDMKAVIAAEGIMPRYLFHALRASRSDILRQVRRSGGSVASLDSQKLWRFEIPIPDLPEQERICRLFDEFDTLVNDLSVGLPAELAARRRQYEYYRDKLLTFKEAAA